MTKDYSILLWLSRLLVGFWVWK